MHGNIMEETSNTEVIKTYIIPDDLCRRAGLGATWIKGNELAVFPYQHTSIEAKDKLSQFAPCAPKIHMLRQQVTLFHPIVRKLVNESNGTFLLLQKLIEQSNGGDLRTELLKISHQYRAIIRACLENLNEAIEATNDKLEKEELSLFVTIFYCIECVWHLCEILYIDTIPGDVVLPQILEWVRLHFPNYEQSATNILEACEVGSEDSPDYWNTVTGMVMQGRIDIARALLKLHSNNDSSHFKLAESVLRTMPTYNAYSSISLNEFTVNWKHWQIDCEAMINSSSFESEPRLEHIMRIRSYEPDEDTRESHSLRQTIYSLSIPILEQATYNIQIRLTYDESFGIEPVVTRGILPCQHTHHTLDSELVAGQRGAIEMARAECPLWRDLLGAWMLFVSPGARRGDLGRIAKACATVRPHGSVVPKPTQLDTILLALLEDDLHQVLHEIQHMSDNNWFATHLTDLLSHCGKLNIIDENQTNVTHQLRDSLVLDYGSLLVGHKSLWPVGFSYLGNCPNRSEDCGNEGLHRANLLMARLPLGSEHRIMKILNEAKKYNLLDVAESICQRQAVSLARRGRTGAALGWALRGRAAPLAARLADTALRQYAITGRLTDTDLVGTLGPEMMLSDRLVFLAKYCEFHRLYKSNELKEAGNLLISLLASKITPSYFWVTLLLDTLPLLECDKPVLTTDDTFEIMHCVEERLSDGVFGDKLELLRLALARNLSRTLLLDDEESENGHG